MLLARWWTPRVISENWFDLNEIEKYSDEKRIRLIEEVKKYLLWRDKGGWTSECFKALLQEVEILKNKIRKGNKQ